MGTKIEYVDIKSIHVDENRRKLDEKKVGELRQSISDIGLLNPINVTKEDGIIRLRSGRHRLEACKRLGWTKIPATILNLDSLGSEAAELDENLVRAELSAYERSIAMARRKEIYEIVHPESKQGGSRKSEPNSSVLAPPFTQVYSARTGKSRSDVELQVKVGKALVPYRDKIRGSIMENKFVELVKLSRIKDVKQREVALSLFLENKVKSVAEVEKLRTSDNLLNLSIEEIFKIDIKVHHKEFGSVNEGEIIIPPASIDLIITNPDWIYKSALPKWSELASFARGVLRPSAYLIVFVQTRFLPHAINALDKELQFYWLCNAPFDGVQDDKTGITSSCRAVLIYNKDPSPREHSHFDDVLPKDAWIGGKRTPTFNAAYAYLLNKLTSKESVVLDPVCGSGAILVEATRIERKAIGLDPRSTKCNSAERAVRNLKDQAAVAIIRARRSAVDENRATTQ
jgi:ParB family chromosome partitioning protein